LTDEAIWSVVDSNAIEDEGATWSVSYRSYPSGNWPSAWTYNPNTYTQNTYADDYLFSPAFNCQAGQTYELKFDALTTHPLDSNSLSVYLTTSPDVVSLSATPLLDHFQVKAENTIAKTIRFTASQTSAYYLVFHANNAPRVAVRAGKLQISSVEINPLANSDIALKSINNPLKGNLSKTTALSVNIQNAGVQAISSSTFTIAYKVNGSGFVSEVLRDVSIPVNGIYTHTFTQTSNFANPGKYEVQIYLSNLLAPLHENANDTLNLSMQNTLTTLPYRPSNGEVYKDHSEESLTWETQDANKDGVNWVISDYFSVSAFSKQMPWRSGIPLEIGSEPANKDFLYSRPLALKAGSQYELSYLRVGVDNYSYMPQKDYMNVYLAVQNSTDFKPVQLLLNDTITEVGKWSTTLKDKPLFSKTIRFSPSKDSIYSLCFESISKLSDNCGGVDVLEISLHELSPVNLALVSVTPPSAACELSSTENLQVTVKNEGVGTANNFTIHYQIDSLPEISQSYTSESISAGQSIQKTIPNVDLSRIAKMNIKIWLTAAADTIHTNDTLCVNAEKYEALFPPYAYTFNNDTANARWASFTGNASESKWSLNTHTSTAKFTYSANADDFLASPCLDLEAGVTYKISFEAQRADAQYIEQLQLLFGRKQKEITNYTALQTFAIEDETFVPLSVYFTPSVSGIHYFAFHALTDNGGGMEIRNVKLNQIKPIDLAIEEIVSPVSGELSKAETVSVRIRNKTSESVNHIPVYCQIEGTLLSGTLDTKLDSNEALLYTFATPVDLSARKNYTLKAYVDYPYDYQHANDTICKNIVSKLAKDVRLDSILNTLDVIYPNMPVPLSIQLSNLGFDTLQWVTVAYLIEGKAAVIDTIHVSLATGASTLYTFAQNLVFTQAQSYTVKVYTLLDQDGNTQNDTLSCNFNVVERPVYDAGVTSLVSPKEGKPISDESVIVKVKNFGNTNLTNIPIVYTLNDEKPVQETISAIAIGEEIEYSFAKKANLDQAKKYIIKAYTLLDNDANKSNDTTLGTIQKVSIEAISKESFRIFPNPCSHIVTLSLEKNIETIELFNSTGQRVFYKALQALNTYSISVADFPKGLYFVRVTTGKTPLIKKLIIE
ncbi:MAG: T9SS type A sorting domain-containing protein, partial [Bacteroidales bacterium]